MKNDVKMGYEKIPIEEGTLEKVDRH